KRMLTPHLFSDRKPRLALRRARPALAFRLFSRAIDPAHRALARGAIMAAPPGDHHSFDSRAAAETIFPFATVHSMALLIVSLEPFRLKKIEDGRTAHADRLPQNLLQFLSQSGRFLWLQSRAGFCGMNARGPQAFVGIDISHPAQNALIEQQRLDPCPAA